jgi:hypothetical protein
MMLSPIGGQASLLLLSVQNITKSIPMDLQYVAKDQAYASAFSGDTAWSQNRNYVRVLFESSRMMPSDAIDRSEDLWTHIKIPYMELMPNSIVGDNGWITIDQTHTAMWASLLGVPISRMNTFGSGSITFSVETQYFTLQCADLQSTTCGTLPNKTAYQTNPASWWDKYPVLNTSFILAITTPLFGRHEGNHSLPARNIIWQSNGTQECKQTRCSLALSHVEANVTCTIEGYTHRSCLVTQMRPSRRPHPPENFTPFDNSTMLQSFFDKWPELHAALGFEDPWPASYSLSQWLTVRWNTVWHAGVAARFHMQAPSTGSFMDAAFAPVSVSVILNTTSATYTFRRWPYYACAKYWLALLVVVSCALLLSAVVGFWAKYTTIAPDILTHASSLTRDNPYIPLPPGGNTLDGMERAHALKHLRVRLQDVQPDAPVGHVALALDDPPTAGPSTSQPATPAGYLQKGRRYV